MKDIKLSLKGEDTILHYKHYKWEKEVLEVLK